MFFIDLLFALAIAIVFTLIFAAGFRRHAVGPGLLFFLLILFLATWAGGLWVTPFGPVMWGASWLPFLLVGLFFALLLTALIPPSGERSMAEEPPPPHEVERRHESSIIAINIFVWILVLALLIVILAAYL